jgi:hypothetical protein
MKRLGGLSSIISGALLFLAHTLGLGKSESMMIISETLVLCAHLILVFAFFRLYSVQGSRNGLFGLFGMIIGIVGTILVTAIVYVEIAGASGAKVEEVFATGVPNFIQMIGPLLFVLGMILFGVSVIGSKVLPRIGGTLLILGTVIFAAGSFAGNAESIFSFFGSAVTGGGFVWLGISSFKEEI